MGRNGRENLSGRLLIGIEGIRIDEPTREVLMHPAVGGVVLFGRNFESRGQLLDLVSELRRLREPRLLLCVDQEGGRVQRLQDGFTRLPPLRTLGRLHAEDAAKGLDMAYRHGRVMATELLACGIDLSFAPVLDLDRGSQVIGDRSFADDPRIIVDLGRAYLGGMRDAGMRSTGKHFPGHGSVAADSHVDDVTDVRSLREIEQSDLVPFVRLGPELDALMVAHVVYPAVDSQPAGYSAIWLKQILRQRLGYAGVVLSDDLGMHAARAAGGLEQRCLACLRAGCDLILVCQPEDVESLLGGPMPVELCEAGPAAPSLQGRPTVDGDDLIRVAQEGIREWAHWQRSLEALGGQAWG